MPYDLFKTLINRPYVPLRLAPNLVMGNIRWQRHLGLPEGSVVDAFSFACTHVDVFTDYDTPSRTRKITTQLPVQATEGPHDEHYFRVSYLTEALQTHGTSEPNQLVVSFREGLKWSAPVFPPHGRRTIAPSLLQFQYVNEAQSLPDIEVFYAFETFEPRFEP